MNRFPAMTIAYRIRRQDGTIHSGKFRYDNDDERRRFGESCRDCYLAGELIETWRVGSAPKLGDAGNGPEAA